MQKDDIPKIDCQLFFGGQMVKMNLRRSDDSSEVFTSIEFVGNEFPAEFVAAVNATRQVLEAYANGVDIGRWFTPDRNLERETEIIKCQWRKDNTLRVIDQSPDKKFLHADTVREAIVRPRNFTCTRYVYRICPKRRGRKSSGEGSGDE